METETMVDVRRAVQAMLERPPAPAPRSETSEAHAGDRSVEYMAWMQPLAAAGRGRSRCLKPTIRTERRA